MKKIHRSFYILFLLTFYGALLACDTDNSKEFALSPHSSFSDFKTSRQAYFFDKYGEIKQRKHFSEKDQKGKKYYAMEFTFGSTLFFSQLSEKEAIYDGGFLSCTAIVLKGEDKRTNEAVYGLIHLYPDKKIHRDINKEMTSALERFNKIISKNFTITSMGIIPTLEPKVERYQWDEKQKQNLMITTILESFRHSSMVSNLYLRRGIYSITQIAVSPEGIELEGTSQDTFGTLHEVIEWEEFDGISSLNQVLIKVEEKIIKYSA